MMQCKIYIPWIIERLDNLVDPKKLDEKSIVYQAYEKIIPTFKDIVKVWKQCGPFTPLGGSTSGFNYAYVELSDLDWFTFLTTPTKPIQSSEPTVITAE